MSPEHEEPPRETPAHDHVTGTHRPSAKGAVRNSVAIVSAQMAGSVVRTCATLLLLWILPKDGYGILTAAVAFVDPIRSLATLGMDAIALRTAAVRPRELPRIIGSLLRIRLVLALIAFGVATIAAFTIRADEAGGAAVIVGAAIAILPAAVYGPLEAAFQSRQRMSRLVTIPPLANLAYVGLVVLLWQLNAPLPLFIASAAAAEVVAAVLTARRVGAELEDAAGPGARLEVDGALVKEMLREGLPLAYVNVVVVLYSRAGVYLLEQTGSMEDVADLGAALKLVGPIIQIGAAMAVSLSPYTSRLTAEGGFREFRTFFRLLVIRILCVLAPLAALGGWLARPFLEWAKPDYVSAVPAIRWYAIAALWMIVCQASTACLVGLGRFRTIALIETVNLAIFISLALHLVPALRAEGVAISTLGMQFANGCMQVVIVVVLLRQRTRRS